MKRMRQLWHALVIETLAVLALVFAISMTSIPFPDSASEDPQERGDRQQAPRVVQTLANGLGG